MKLSEWLDAETGRATAMALHFRVQPPAITFWRDRVPVKRMREVREYTGGAVGFEDMLPGEPIPRQKRAKKSPSAARA